jgi:hypothetical protein
MCGGVNEIPCPMGSTCVDNPNDNCDPVTSATDCDGFCQCNAH